MRISDWSSDVCSSDLIELVPVIAVDEHKLLANRNEIHRIDALACPRDRVALIVEDVLLPDHRRIEDPAACAHRQCDSSYRSRTPDTRFRAPSELGIHALNSPAGFAGPQLLFDRAAKIALRDAQDLALLALVCSVLLIVWYDCVS